jgi:hypothetical protein
VQATQERARAKTHSFPDGLSRQEFETLADCLAISEDKDLKNRGIAAGKAKYSEYVYGSH